VIASHWARVAILAGILLTACRAAAAGAPGAPDAAAPNTGSVGAASEASTAASLAPAARELRVGDPAPDFTLPDQNRQNVTLSQFHGRTVQIAFYVWALSPG
jgi:cytochrome oxidase Cu insertion factor (SCO1/SenC/PrrC family)